MFFNLVYTRSFAHGKYDIIAVKFYEINITFSSANEMPRINNMNNV